MTKTTNTPQDVFVFTVAAVEYELPNMQSVLTGAQLREIIGADNPDVASAKVAALTLARVASKEALAAYDSLPFKEAAKVLSDWQTQNVSGATLPE
jgi:hypothetical protein